MLTIRNVNKQFDGTPVLNNVSLSVNKGDVIAIIGQSGGGKTTLLRCMNFLETADSGEMEFDGACFDLQAYFCQADYSYPQKDGFRIPGLQPVPQQNCPAKCDAGSDRCT